MTTSASGITPEQQAYFDGMVVRRNTLPPIVLRKMNDGIRPRFA